MSKKNTSDTIGNKTYDLPACSAVPQPIAPLRAPEKTKWVVINVRERRLNMVLFNILHDITEEGIQQL